MDAICYAAKSTEDHGGSIPDQLKDGRALCEREGNAVVAEYQDEAKSAYKGSRGDGLAKAMEHAKRIAPCVLVVQHSDRLARGDAVKGAHLVEYALWAIKAGVTIKSVQDPRACDSILDAALMGMRNNEDSERKSKATKDGLRRTAEKGEWRGGILPGGYDAEYEHDGSGKLVERRLVKHAEDRAAYELLWKLAAEGRSVQTISLEMNQRGYKTRPPQSHIAPKAFSTRRVIQALNTPAYAGLIVWNGETFAATWEAYIDPETFWRLKAERRERGHGHTRKRGRPPVGYLLAELAYCAKCGEPMHAESGRRRRDGSVARFYVCRAHREHHRDDPSRCPVERFDAEAVDRDVIDGIDKLLGDATALLRQLEAGQRAERDKLERVAARASEVAEAAERAAERATTEFATAADADERALLKDAAKVKRAEAKRERARADAALDALADETTPDPVASANALRERLAGALASANGDVKILNAALREHFEAFALSRLPDGSYRVVPALREESMEWLLLEPAADGSILAARQ